MAYNQGPESVALNPMPPETKTGLVADCDKEVNAGFISYLVSAPLHGRGSLAFWQSGNKSPSCYAIITRVICIIDLIWHVALWGCLFVWEIWTYNTFQTHMQHTDAVPAVMAADGVTELSPAVDAYDHRMADAHGESSRVILDELYVGQFTTWWIAFFGLVVSIIFGLLGQPAGKAWPSTLCFIFGGLKASLLFTVLIILVASNGGWVGFNSALEAGQNGHQETITMRQLALWSAAFKMLLLAQLSANEKFWGSGSDDDMYANMCHLLGKLDVHKYERKHVSSGGYIRNAHQEWKAPLPA